MNVERLQAENARLRGALQATNQLVIDLEAKAERADPMAAAAHTFCSVFLSEETNGTDVLAALAPLLRLHNQQTPQPPPEVPT